MIARVLACAGLALACGSASSDETSLLQFGANVQDHEHGPTSDTLLQTVKDHSHVPTSGPQSRPAAVALQVGLGGDVAHDHKQEPQASAPAQPAASVLQNGRHGRARRESPDLTGKTMIWHSLGVGEGQVKTGQAIAVAVIMLIALVLLITEMLSPDVIMFAALCIVWNLGILTNLDALAGFSNSSLVVVGSMFVVVKGVDRSKLIDRSARGTLGAKTSQFMSLARLSGITLFFGCFINNAPLVALFMPIVRDWARTREFAPSKFLMPLSYASVGGGVLTLIGTSTNLVINGMMQDDTGETFGFFDPARVGILQNIFTMIYMLTLGVRLLPDEKGGLFRTLKERKPDMVTELQIEPNFPLVGTSVTEVLESIGVPREALLKIFRQPMKKNPAIRASPAGAWMVGKLQRAVSEEGPMGGRSDVWHSTSTILRYTSSPNMTPLSYQERTQHCWGRVQRRGRSLTDSSSLDDLRPRPRSLSVGEVTEQHSGRPEPGTTIDVDDPDLREIFPVPEQEVVLAGDMLLLSLPRDVCVDFANSGRASKLLPSVSEKSPSDPAQADKVLRTVGIRMCDMDLLEIPGRQGEFVELVVSQSNPFVGTDFSGAGRREFEEHYQVAVLAVRQSTWSGAAGGEHAKADHLLSYANQRSVKHNLGKAAETEEEDHEVVRSPSETSEDRFHMAASSPCTGGVFQEAVPEKTQASGQSQGEPPSLRPGDAVLVLAKAGSEAFAGQDFLASTTVAHEPQFQPSALDYAPLALFIIGIVLVASQQVTMVQISMALAAIYLVCGWVTPKELREGIDWNMLILIGSALGLAKAVQESGLSGAIASVVKGANLGKRGTVFVLFFVTMVVTELVTNNAAAALAFPLASALTRQMNLNSVKPLAMTVMLATSTCYVNPIGTAPNLMVMGPGGYTFRDFVKVGFLMDIICWVNAGIFIPLLWPMEEIQEGEWAPTLTSATTTAAPTTMLTTTLTTLFGG